MNIEITRPFEPSKAKAHFGVRFRQHGFGMAAFIGLVLVFGLETYYQNRYGDADTTYVGGLFSAVCGIMFVLSLILAREQHRAIPSLVARKADRTNYVLRLTDEGVTIAIQGYVESFFAWACLSTYQDKPQHVVLRLAGRELIVNKDLFEQEQLGELMQFLKENCRTRELTRTQ